MLLFHLSASAAKTEIEVTDGVIVLRGDATSLAQKELTAEYARDAEAVCDVRNEILISMTSEQLPLEAGEAIDDASVAAQVNMVLLLHRSISGLTPSITIQHNIVTVEGIAWNAYAKNQITKFVKDVHGVKSVTNRMTLD